MSSGAAEAVVTGDDPSTGMRGETEVGDMGRNTAAYWKLKR
jgi:hypothetical protein